MAFQFLTIIPVTVKGEFSKKEIAGSSSFFAVVGVFQGLVALLSSFLLLKLFNVEIAGGLLLALLTTLNGGFHLDGLADTFDALAVKSSGDKSEDRRKRLAVMKDSSTGAIGTVAVIIMLILKYQLITWTLGREYWFLFLMPVMSKWVMVISMYFGRPAREDGLGKMFVTGTGIKEVITATFALALAFGLFHSIAGMYVPGRLHLLYGLIIAATFLFSLAGVSFFSRKFGGLTGDTLGATSEATEILFLLVVAIWSRHSI